MVAKFTAFLHSQGTVIIFELSEVEVAAEHEELGSNILQPILVVSVPVLDAIPVQIAVGYRRAVAAALDREDVTLLHLVQSPVSVVANILDLRLDILLNEEDSVVEQGGLDRRDCAALCWIVVDNYTVEKYPNHVPIHDHVLVIGRSSFWALDEERGKVTPAHKCLQVHVLG